MVPNGHISLLLFLPFLLYFVAPSDGLKCLMKSNFNDVHGKSTKEQILGEIRDKYPTVEKFQADPAANFLLSKAMVLILGDDIYTDNCQPKQQCCSKYYENQGGKPVETYSCSDKCKVDNKIVLTACAEDFCNKENYPTPQKEFSFQQMGEELTRLFSKINKDYARYLRQNGISKLLSGMKEEPVGAGQQTNISENGRFFFGLFMTVSLVFLFI